MRGMPWSTGGIFQVTVITFVPFSYTSLDFELCMVFHIFFDVFGDFVLKRLFLFAKKKLLIK